jgi:hypothetical protein
MELARAVATNVFDIVEDFAVVFAQQVHQRAPELGAPTDARAVEATRRSSVGSMHEFLTIMRARIYAPNAMETSPEALEHVRYLQSRGVGLTQALRFYHIGIAMFEPVVVAELARLAPDTATLERMKSQLRIFMFQFVDRLTKRLAAEYGLTERDGWSPDPNDPVWHNPECVAVAEAFVADYSSTTAEPRGAARAHAESALARFRSAIEAAAGDPELCRVVARADTTVGIELADERDLGLALLLDRQPIAVVERGEPTDIELSIASTDLDRLCSPEFHLAMAIARGRVTYSGDVRKFLRVTPILRHASLPERTAPVLTTTA